MTRAADRELTRVEGYALALLLLTSVHHAYGAYIYQTPWRLHVLAVAAAAAAIIVPSARSARRRQNGRGAGVAFWVFTGAALIVPFGLIGLYEGWYNHVLKNVFYFAGASAGLMQSWFPPPMYELPDDAFFEITGIAQALLAVPGLRGLCGCVASRLIRRGGATRAAACGTETL